MSGSYPFDDGGITRDSLPREVIPGWYGNTLLLQHTTFITHHLSSAYTMLSCFPFKRFSKKSKHVSEEEPQDSPEAQAANDPVVDGPENASTPNPEDTPGEPRNIWLHSSLWQRSLLLHTNEYEPDEYYDDRGSVAPEEDGREWVTCQS